MSFSTLASAFLHNLVLLKFRTSSGTSAPLTFNLSGLRHAGRTEPLDSPTKFPTKNSRQFRLAMHHCQRRNLAIGNCLFIIGTVVQNFISLSRRPIRLADATASAS